MKNNLGRIALSLISKTVIMTTISAVIITSGKGTVSAKANEFQPMALENPLKGGVKLPCIEKNSGDPPEDEIALGPVDSDNGISPILGSDSNNNEPKVDVPEPDLNLGLIILIVLGAGALLKQNIKTKKDL